MPKHVDAEDTITDPTGIMSGTPLNPVIDAMAAKAAMGFSPVATTGSYSDLTAKPSIPVAQVQADWNQASSGAADFVKNKPSIPASQLQADYGQASSGSVDFIRNKPPARSRNAASRSFVTTAASTGFQVSSSRDSLASYSVTVSTTATIAGSATGTVFLETAATNSATPSDWTEIARFTNGQVLSLAITLQSVQTTAGILFGFVPAGYYARIRTQNVAGTPSFTYVSGSETLL